MKYSTFWGRGFFARQVGRQNMPVVLTATKKIPSYERSDHIRIRQNACSEQLTVGDFRFHAEGAQVRIHYKGNRNSFFRR